MEHVRGRLVPGGDRLIAALAAGILWLLAVAVMVRVPAAVRTAALSAQRTREGVAWAGVGAALVACGVALGVAAVLSSRAHGSAAAAPWQVRLLRALTWTAFAVLVFGALAAPGLAGPDCFRTCQPFPR